MGTAATRIHRRARDRSVRHDAWRAAWRHPWGSVGATPGPAGQRVRLRRVYGSTRVREFNRSPGSGTVPCGARSRRRHAERRHTRLRIRPSSQPAAGGHVDDCCHPAWGRTGRRTRGDRHTCVWLAGVVCRGWADLDRTCCPALVVAAGIAVVPGATPRQVAAVDSCSPPRRTCDSRRRGVRGSRTESWVTRGLQAAIRRRYGAATPLESGSRFSSG